ncbi:MAG TPA: quinolinate synthase NadA [Acidimicrobiales bacterium]|nr:quinolinate synthase NadA [Acidimicrobiales bacterium]
MFRLQTPLPDRYTSATPEQLVAWISDARAALGGRLVILGHHYQRDEVMRWADARGDSFGLARFAADQREAEYVVFCGVQFMAESADVLTADHQQVILPDLNAGCSMADMADLDSVETAWEELAEVVDIASVVPITYMNSSAVLKSFVGRHGGAVCTSSNARAVLSWALGLDEAALDDARRTGLAAPTDRKVLFFPDQHLGRNTAFQLGYAAEDMAVWNPRRDLGGLEDAEAKEATFLLWQGHCSVHQRFRTGHVEEFRRRHPDGVVLVHPECAHEVVELADEVGSTDAIIRYVEAAPTGSAIGIATEIHLVHRLADEHPHLEISSLDPLVCPCSTMFRIDAPHLAWVLEGLVAGEVRNRVVVDPETAEGARIALERMLAIT